jgi:hypothetical protein
MAGQPKVYPPPPVAAQDPDVAEAYFWIARSDRIWSRVMSTYHLVTEDELWLVLLEAAKDDPPDQVP